MDYELGIIGAGPAGYSASIYAGRSGISAVTFDKMGGGGLALITPKIENYAGFETISGAELMEKMQKHANQYADLKFLEEVSAITKKETKFTITTSNSTYATKAIILAMGSEYRRLGVPGEGKFIGKGVSYCATCDGNFFKGKNVAVIGGGNSALVEAVFLQQVGCKKVTVIHRRDRLRAEKAYETEALEKGVNFYFNTHVEQIRGTEIVESLELHDTDTGEKRFEPFEGVFISIGEIPQNEVAKQMKVNLDEKGYIVVDRQQRTNIRGVYAAGDITGGVRQVITAAAEGAVAALSSLEVLGKQYPY